MNTRTTAFLVIGMLVVLLSLAVHFLHSSPVSFVSGLALAQTPSSNTITLKPVPNTSGDEDDLWQHYEVTVPSAHPPLDLHAVFLVDGHGIEQVKEVQPQRQPIPLKYRLMTDDHSDAVLAAQGYHPNKKLVTYFFMVDAATGIVSENNLTVKYKRGIGASRIVRPVVKTKTATVGEKIVLEDLLLDEEKPGYYWESQDHVTFDPKVPPGAAHHLIVYIIFQPHKGGLGDSTNPI